MTDHELYFLALGVVIGLAVMGIYCSKSYRGGGQ